MTKEDILQQVKENYRLLKDHPERNNDKDVFFIAIQKDCAFLCYASEELIGNKEIILKFIMKHNAICIYSLLECYQYFDEIVEKESLFSCWNNF